MSMSVIKTRSVKVFGESGMNVMKMRKIFQKYVKIDANLLDVKNGKLSLYLQSESRLL
jgi:hypothetical protein